MYADLGPGQLAELKPPSEDGMDVLYDHEFVADRMRQRNLYLYVENSPIANLDPSGLYTIAARITHLTLKAKFDAWYKLEQGSRAWYSILPKCPCSICLTADGTAKSPDSSVWSDPKPKRDFPKGPWVLVEFLLKPVYPAPDLHPGAKWDMRPKAPSGGYGNQCMYDATGKLITGGRGAGTADKRYYGKVDYHTWDVAKLIGGIDKATQMFKHWQHDVIPFWAAWLLDGKTWGPNVDKYLKVRPPVIDKKCPTNIVPPAK